MKENIKKQKEELQKQIKELERQEEEIIKKEREEKIVKNKERLDILRENKEFVLSLIEHGRTSCSDEYPNNGYRSASYGARCNKCHLIEILDCEYNNDFEVHIDLIITKI